MRPAAGRARRPPGSPGAADGERPRGAGLRVAALYLHPVKSCRAVRVERARLDALGLVDDRRWMVVDSDGRFRTLRDTPELRRIRPVLEPEGLRLEAPGLEPLVLPRGVPDGPRLEVAIWGARVPAVEHAAGSAWVTRALGLPARLVALAPEARRPLRGDSARAVAFVDAEPLLVLGTASIADLARRAGIPLDPERFRANVLVEGAPPYAEDAWARIRIGTIPVRLTRPCERCAVPTIDPATGARGPEPLRALASYRRRGRGVVFGMNAVHEGEGELRVGDPVEVLEPRERP